MKIWAISDTHFSDNEINRMENFGRIWSNHSQQIVQNWGQSVRFKDIVFVGGDISWANKMERGMIVIKRFSSLPGQAKVLVRGNHDIWWSDHDKFCQTVPKDVYPLWGSAVKIAGHVICGTGGWISPEDPCADSMDGPTYRRELKLLEKALDEAVELKPEEGIHVLLHFPPFTTEGLKNGFFHLMKKYPVITCSYGHFHMPEEWKKIPKGLVDGIQCNLTASDYLKHQPAKIWES